MWTAQANHIVAFGLLDPAGQGAEARAAPRRPPRREPPPGANGPFARGGQRRRTNTAPPSPPPPRGARRARLRAPPNERDRGHESEIRRGDARFGGRHGPGAPGRLRRKPSQRPPAAASRPNGTRPKAGAPPKVLAPNPGRFYSEHPAGFARRGRGGGTGAPNKRPPACGRETRAAGRRAPPRERRPVARR